jgi:hypothetical protein
MRDRDFSLWKDSFNESIMVSSSPFVVLTWLLLTTLVELVRAGYEGQVTIASFFLMSMVTFSIIIGVIFLVRTHRNLRYIVLKENPEYAKKRISLKEIFSRQITF